MEREGTPSGGREETGKIPLAQVSELEELKARYDVYSDEVLMKWVNAVTGSHRNAIASILKDRGLTP